jgi:hypothetical protein
MEFKKQRQTKFFMQTLKAQTPNLIVNKFICLLKKKKKKKNSTILKQQSLNKGNLKIKNISGLTFG